MALIKEIKILLLCIFAVSCNLIIATHATILRLPCTTFAEFDRFEVNKALKGSLIRKDQGLGDAECMMKCVEHERCRSYNFNWEQKECELNEKRFGDANTQLMDAAGWVYKSTNYDNLLIGSTCKSLAPCLPDVLCRDTCTSPFYECVYCDKKHKGLHCDILIDQNDCEKNPCQNGTCVDTEADYRCTCNPGYTGIHCETDVDECHSLPCFNGGACLDQIGKYQCTCLPGYSGTHCESDINECASSPCSNGGTCQDQIASFKCSCAPGYTGKTCETNIDECASSPCLNGATCQDQIASFKCTCAHGYTGIKCESDINECTSSPCLNGGTCQNQIPFFKCTCASGYTGQICEADINECGSLPCANGGTCHNTVGSFACTCASGYIGATCSESFQAAYVGCYIDAGDRALPHPQSVVSHADPLVGQCINKCHAIEQPYAGLQYYNQCWCGSTYSKHGQASESSCNTACRDSSGMKCGGGWKNSVYRTGFA